MKTVGIKLADGSFYPVMEEGSVQERTLDLTTAHNNQTCVMVDMYRSKTCSMDDAEYIDTLKIENLNAHTSGEPDISFSVGLDENNQLKANIIDPETGAESNSTITLVSRTIEERLQADDYSIAHSDKADEATEINHIEVTEEPSDSENKAAAGIVAGAGLLAAAGAIAAKQQKEEEDSVVAEDEPVFEETYVDEPVADEVEEPVAEEIDTPAEEPVVEVADEPAEAPADETILAGDEVILEDPESESSDDDFNLGDPAYSKLLSPDFNDDADDDFRLEEPSADDDFKLDDITESNDALDLPDFEEPEEDFAGKTTDEDFADFSIPDFDDSEFEDPELNKTELDDTDFDTNFADTSLDDSNDSFADPGFDDDDFTSSDDSNDMASSGGGISFTGLYDKETELGESGEEEKKTKIPVIICIICAIICLLATALVLFVIPSKFNLIKKNTESTVVVEKTETATTAPAVETAPVKAPEPQIPAKEDEVVIIPEAETVIPLPPPVVEEEKEVVKYKIKWGDTLWDIADTFYKNPWRYKYIAKHNNIRNPDHIISGTIIEIPED